MSGLVLFGAKSGYLIQKLEVECSCFSTSFAIPFFGTEETPEKMRKEFAASIKWILFYYFLVTIFSLIINICFFADRDARTSIGNS